MNWHEFRKYHVQKYGPTPLPIIVERYKQYKKKLLNIEIYSKPTCPFCVKAKKLLKRYKLPFHEYDVNIPKYRHDMIKRTNNAKTVPQIFINSKLIGGYDHLFKLEQKGYLKKLL
jgi:glutaredoxin 3